MCPNIISELEVLSLSFARHTADGIKISEVPLARTGPQIARLEATPPRGFEGRSQRLD